jgi:DNA-binding transcriptional LysR family regulator
VLNPQWLRTFSTLVELGNLTRTDERLAPLELVAPAGQDLSTWADLERLGARPWQGFTNQIGLILDPVGRGLGFSVLPRDARLAFAQPERIQVIEGTPQVVDTLWLLRRAEWPLSARAQTVLQHLRPRFGPSSPSATT